MEILKDKNGLGTILKIHSFKDLTPAELKLQQQKLGTVGVKLVVSNRNDKMLDYYTPRTYKRLYKKMDELLEGIEDNLDDPLIFLFTYRRINKYVSNDHISGKKEESNNHLTKFKNSKNLIGPLLEGEALCYGIALLLKVAMDFKDVPCTYIRGLTDGEDHAWNQVCLKGRWIGVDCTWDIGGGMKHCGQDPIEFNNKHEYYSLKDFIKEDNHLIYHKFDWSKYLNNYFHIQTDCEYNEDELEYYFDLLEDALTRDGNIKTLKEEIEVRVFVHDRVKLLFRDAGYDYKSAAEAMQADELELYSWIMEESHKDSPRTSKIMIDDYEIYKKKQNAILELKDTQKLKLKEEKANRVSKWAQKNEISFELIKELDINLDDLYDIVFSQKYLHMNNKEILNADDRDFYEKMFVNSKEYNIDKYIDNAVATIGEPYIKLRRIGLTDFILAELGKAHFTRKSIMSLLKYKYRQNNTKLYEQ